MPGGFQVLIARLASGWCTVSQAEYTVAMDPILWIHCTCTMLAFLILVGYNVDCNLPVTGITFLLVLRSFFLRVSTPSGSESTVEIRSP